MEDILNWPSEFVGIHDNVKAAVDSWLDKIGSQYHDVSPKAVLPTAVDIYNENARYLVKDTHLVEGCSGAGNVSKLYRESGKVAIEFDRETRHQAEDMTQLYGLVQMAMSVGRLKKRALLTYSPECKTFGAPMRFTSGRDAGIFCRGNEDRADVRNGNHLADAGAWLMELADLSHAFSLVEQPLGSLFWCQPSVQMAIESVQSQRIFTWRGGFGDLACAKPTELYSSLPKDICETWFARSKPVLSQDESVHTTCKAGWWSGGKNLKGTQVFSRGFCEAIYNCHEAACERLHNVDSVKRAKTAR